MEMLGTWLESGAMACFYIFAFVLVLSFVVLVHEGGHFLVARWCGVKVEEFSLGFGHELCGWNDKKGTRWKICLFPLGGYVKMLGDQDAAGAQSTTKNLPPKLRKYAFMSQKLWKRAAIIFAGPATNYIFAVFIFWMVLFFTGVSVLPAIIDEVEDNSAAQEVGMLPGDRIVDVNGHEIKSFTDVQRAIRMTEFGKELTVQFERGGEIHTVQMTPRYMDKDSDHPRIGVRVIPRMHYQAMEPTKIGLVEAFQRSVSQVWVMTRDTLSYLGQVLFNGRPPKEMRGPLGIAEASGDAFEGGFYSLLIFIGSISVAVGLMNLLPIPLLDGGHLALYLLEAIRRKPLTEKVQNAVMWMGFSILIGLVGYTFFLDIPRIIKRIFE